MEGMLESHHLSYELSVLTFFVLFLQVALATGTSTVSAYLGFDQL